MLLSVYVGRSYLSAVLFNTDPFSVKAKAFVAIPYVEDSFFAVSTISQISSIVKKELEISDSDFSDLNKILISPHISSSIEIEGWHTSVNLNQVLDAVSGRIFIFSEDNLEKYLESDSSKMNIYANHSLYHVAVPTDLLISSLKLQSASYWDITNDPKSNLKEVIFSTHKYDVSKSDQLELEFAESLAHKCNTNKIIEITYDYGFFLIPIISALIFQKSDPKEFFASNPIHIDTKIIIIPNMENEIECEDTKGNIFPIEAVPNSRLLKVDGNDGDTVIVKSKNPKKKVHLELLGCKSGIYFDLSTKSK